MTTMHPKTTQVGWVITRRQKNGPHNLQLMQLTRKVLASSLSDLADRTEVIAKEGGFWEGANCYYCVGGGSEAGAGAGAVAAAAVGPDGGEGRSAVGGEGRGVGSDGRRRYLAYSGVLTNIATSANMPDVQTQNIEYNN